MHIIIAAFALALYLYLVICVSACRSSLDRMVMLAEIALAEQEKQGRILRLQWRRDALPQNGERHPEQ